SPSVNLEFCKELVHVSYLLPNEVALAILMIKSRLPNLFMASRYFSVMTLTSEGNQRCGIRLPIK
ncbi:Hypothetical protein FKW44_004847, partial [Caligus rogercresseyi]